MNIEKFDPTVAELTKIADAARAVVVTDFNDAKQIGAVSDARKGLKRARVSITKRGKELREEAIAFQKSVIEKEKELIAIIEPEETRLVGIEAEIEKAEELERIRIQLPGRRVRLGGLSPKEATVTDELLLTMDARAFEAYFVTRVQALAAEEREALAAERTKIAEAEAKRQHEEKVRADERAKIAAEEEARRRATEAAAQAQAAKVAEAAQEAATRTEREAKAKADAIVAEARAKVEAERVVAQKAEQARLDTIAENEKRVAVEQAEFRIQQAKEVYVSWAKSLDTTAVIEFNPQTRVYEAWKLIGSFNPNL